MLALSSFHCQASHQTVGVRLSGAGGVEVAHMYESVEVWVSMRRTFRVTTGLDTYHDFQPAWTVGVMRAVSTQRQGATRRTLETPHGE